MQKLEEIFGKFEARVAEGILVTLYGSTAPVDASSLVQKSKEEVRVFLKNPYFNPRVADYEAMFMQLQREKYVMLTDSAGEPIPEGIGVAESDQVQFTKEGKPFFGQNYVR